ncbi:Lar family restriction alleviation protein [Burkholderia multivorans]|uniref:Lar family restriction alleviation protein n=1 Tax=Burkholderia multivorans TaxID=87883 RepID=UPI00285475A8|nr:hypothetical protein [Burkholderia multivorans]MDR8926417.1 hypothetical protein [Burkholderia multivorans]MDR8964002.1 hypothetical protein [Burkholderia multivorans]MDR8992373.1 hypothetical protein [Burkholderia multivorans]MDR9019216.1 hypothetical protein [Burkholderia multivorans]
MSDVLPCPFCGKPPYMATEIDPDEWWYVACQTPGCILPAAAGHTSIESAIAKWNRRAHASEGDRIRCSQEGCQFKVARIGEPNAICPADHCAMLIVAKESES